MYAPGDYFHFRGFSLANKNAAFRINTDGVLLACWASLDETDTSILDIGTGTGVIPCIIHARYKDRTITAIDSDYHSFLEAHYNFSFNALKNVNAVHGRVQDFASYHQSEFDHIISNPPYFQNDTKPGHPGLNAGKHARDLSLNELIEASQSLLKPDGSMSIILPEALASGFKAAVNSKGFGLKAELKVRSRHDKAVIRRLMLFKKAYNLQAKEEELCLFTDTDRNHTEAYTNLVGDFYL